MSAGRLLAVGLIGALLASGCGREKDPLKVMKPPQLQEEAERRLSQGDIEGAEKVFRLALAKFEEAGLKGEALHPHLLPLIHLAIKRGDVAEGTKLLNRVFPPDVAAANNIAVLLHGAGKLDEARDMAERAARTMAAKPTEDDAERGRYLAAWTTIDRLRVARFDRPGAGEASKAFLDLLMKHGTFDGRYHALPRGLRAPIVRYQDFLFATDRDALAKQIGDIVERIDQNAPPDPNDALCVRISEDRLQNLGCMLEIQ